MALEQLIGVLNTHADAPAHIPTIPDDLSILQFMQRNAS